MLEPSALRTTKQAGQALPSSGPRWNAAIEYGIDVTLIERNMQLSVSERLLQLDDMLSTYFALRPRSDD